MSSSILGLHHVTATVDDAQSDLDFCVGVLGLRFVKRTVNFDNQHVFHFYYGDERGTPGTIWTTFPYRGFGVRRGTHGAGQITSTLFSVPPGALTFWRDRLQASGAHGLTPQTVFGESVLTFDDPSGLRIGLVECDDPRHPWTTSATGASVAIRGVHHVTASIAAPPATIRFMEDVLGFAVTATEGPRTRLAVGGTGPGHFVDLLATPDAAAGLNGLGTVHHVALAVGTAGGQQALRERLLQRGVQVTRVLDRQYFQSIYFREPGGVLFEIATIAPGFTVDEPLDRLGHALKLPGPAEPERRHIEAGLPAITVPETLPHART